MRTRSLAGRWLAFAWSLAAPVFGHAVTITCPPDQVVLTCSGSAVANYRVTATEHAGEIVCSPPSGSSFTLGTHTVTCTATNLAGESATCSFQVIVKEPPTRWPCPPKELGIGIPFETIGGATTFLRPGPGIGQPGISIVPAPASADGTAADSGIVLRPGDAQAITFSTRLDALATAGSGFDVLLPPDAAHPLDPPILSVRSKGRNGYCIKVNKRFADEPGSSLRAFIVNSNGTILPPLEFTPAEVEANGILDIGFQPGVTNCHLMVEIARDGTISIELPGPVTQSYRRKGWDGCIYGPDRPVKKPTARLIVQPTTPSPLPSDPAMTLRTSGWPEMIVEEPSLTMLGRKWGDGHVTLMKAYDDGEQGVEFVSLATNGGVHVDLGPSTSAALRFAPFPDSAGLPVSQTFRVRGGNWPPGTTTNRPPPPFALRLSDGAAGVECSVDYSAFGTSNVTVELRKGGALIETRPQQQGHLQVATCTLSTRPIIVGCPGVGVLRLADSKMFTVSWGDGTATDCDDVRFVPELEKGATLAESFSVVECLGSDGLQAQLSALQSTPATPRDPLTLACPADIVTGATSPSGAFVTFGATVHPGECTAFPYPAVSYNPPSGSLFPIGTTLVTASVTNGCGEVATCTFHVTVDGRPGIVTQPASVVVTAGAPAQFTAQAYSASPASYLWQIFCPPTRPDWPFCGNFPAQTWRPLCLGCPPPIVDFPSVTAAMGGAYYLVVSNDFGVTVSDFAYLTVVPQVTCPPDLVLVTCSNSAIANFRVDATGAEGEVVCSPASGSAFPLGTTTVTCTATNYSEGSATCSFNVTVKQSPARWGCDQVGVGLPYQSFGGAAVVVRPDTGDGDPAIVISPSASGEASGVRFSPGAAQAIQFTAILDFTAPAGTGFDILLPPDPLHPNDPPLLSFARKSGAGGYCVKMAKKFADEPGAQYRAFAVNTNGDLLDPIVFSLEEINTSGVFDINFQPGVTNCHVTVELNLVNGSMTVEIPGTLAPSAARKGWDGCIYGPDRPRPKPPKTARVLFAPPVSPGQPPITELALRAVGRDVTFEQPTLTAAGRKWGDGHVTLMKAYDDGEQGVEFRTFAPGGGVHVDLGQSDSFRVALKRYFETGDVPTQDQLITRTIGPIRGLTNRPPPPFLDALKLQHTDAGIACAADFSNIDSPTVRVVLLSNNVVVAERTGVSATLANTLFTLPDWPETLSKLAGTTPCRRGTFKPGLVRLASAGDGGLPGPEQLVGADEFRVLAEPLPGAPHPDYYSGFEFLASEGSTWRVSNIERTLVCTPVPVTVSRTSEATTVSWSDEGFMLEGAATITGPWLNLGATSPLTLPPDHPARYFRLKCD